MPLPMNGVTRRPGPDVFDLVGAAAGGGATRRRGRAGRPRVAPSAFQRIVLVRRAASNGPFRQNSTRRPESGRASSPQHPAAHAGAQATTTSHSTRSASRGLRSPSAKSGSSLSVH